MSSHIKLFIAVQRKVSGTLRKAILVTLGLSVCSGALQAAPKDDKTWREGRVLVKPRAGLPEAEVNKILGQHGGRAIGRLRNLGIHVVQVPSQAEDAVAKALARNPHVKFAEKDMLVEASEIIPDDPQYAQAWHLPKVQAPSAWEMATAEGVTIAILDSGVDTSHPDLADQVVAGWNSVSGNTDTADINGHGTKVAGTAAASTNNTIGVAAIGWNANIMPVRITNRSDGWAYWSDIANGLTWAADHGADVANISYSATNSSSISSAAQYMRNKGGVVVVAAGNDGTDPGWGDNPAIISVSATTSGDTKASWSNYGNYIDVAAPGVGIRTTTNGGGYGSPSGTSFASPATAGLIALIMGANRDLSPDEIESILEASADDPVSGSDWHAYYGYGRINAGAAVLAAFGDAPGDGEAPVVDITAPGAGETVAGLVQVDVDATDNVGVSRVALYVDGVYVGEAQTAPYGFSWDSTQVADGAVTLTAYAYDAAGNEGLSQSITIWVENTAISVNQAPIISSVTATPGTLLETSISQLQVVASDPDGGPEPLSYNWIVPAGGGSLDDPGVPNPVYTPPNVSGIQTVNLTVEVSDGEDITSHTLPITIQDVDASAPDLDESFDHGNFLGWSITDEGSRNGPSAWSAATGTLVQNSNIYNGSDDIAKHGTYAVYEAGSAWSDYRVRLNLSSDDNDAIGLMFRVQDSNNYYRLSWDKQRSYRRLVKNVGGVFSLLAEDNVPYVQGQTYQVEITAEGNTLQVHIDGTPVFYVTDYDLTYGSIAPYSWGNRGSHFDDVYVEDLSGANQSPIISSVTATPGTLLETSISQLQVVASDPDGGPEPLSYNWIVPAGGGSLDDPGVPNPVYTPPNVSGIQTVNLTVEVSDGEDITSHTLPITIQDVDASAPDLDESFDHGNFLGWSITDEGSRNGPSAWSAATGTLVQNSNIYNGSDDIAKHGTYAVYEAGSAWSDYRVRLNLSSDDNDAIGLMFRVQDSNNYYRLSWDKQRSYRRLVKNVGGVFSLLAEDNVPYVQGQTYQVEITAEGNTLQVHIDGTPVFYVTDYDLTYGSIAPYSWGNQGSRFDDVYVEDLSGF